MNKRSEIQIYVEEKDKEKIREASKISGLTLSAFCRNLVLVKTRQILKEEANAC